MLTGKFYSMRFYINFNSSGIYLKTLHVVSLPHLLGQELEPIFGRVLRPLLHRVRQRSQLVQRLNLSTKDKSESLNQFNPEQNFRQQTSLTRNAVSWMVKGLLDTQYSIFFGKGIQVLKIGLQA